MWEQFVTDHMAAALRLDSLRSSHPIQVPIHHAEEVEQVFDAICKRFDIYMYLLIFSVKSSRSSPFFTLYLLNSHLPQLTVREGALFGW